VIARRGVVPAVLLGTALLAWLVLWRQTRGMDMSMSLGPFFWFAGVWVTMTAAMMLPSALPMTSVYARTTGADAVRTGLFVAGYVVAWTAYGLLAYGVYRVARSIGALDWDSAGRYVAGAAVVAAGVYELTPLKALCLRQCRSPLSFLLRSWRNSRPGALRMGGEHGLYCIGCCLGLMAVLFVLGVMSLVWMAVVAALIAAQKLLPAGDRLTAVFAVLFAGLGIWIVVAG
jgi:predicted metal-binding membrane protein